MAIAVYYPTTNKIYVFGGEEFDSGDNYNLTQIYDIAVQHVDAGANYAGRAQFFMAGGYVPGTGKIYILSGYNTGFHR